MHLREMIKRITIEWILLWVASRTSAIYNLRTYPLSTPRIRFMTKKAPRTTMETKYKNCQVFPIAS